MQRRLGAEDSKKLDQYLGGVREIETRIEKAERFGEVRDPAVSREAAARALDAARRRTLALTDVEEPELTAQHSPLMSPLVWDLAHIGQQEDLWLLRRGDARREGLLPADDTCAQRTAELQSVYDAASVEAPLDVFLGMAETPEDALIALYHGGMSSGAVAENLELLMLDGKLNMHVINEPQC